MAKLKILKDPVTGESFYPYTHEKAITDDNGNEVIAKIKSDIATNKDNITKNANDIKTLQEDLSSVGQQVAANKEEIAELNDKKITKFYASNLGKTALNDSDNGKIQDMMIYGISSQFTTTGKNLANGQNANYYINSGANICGTNKNDTGIAIDVSKLTNVTISTRSIQDRYRAGCVDTVPTIGNTVTCYNGKIKDGTQDSYTIDTTGYNYLIVNATKLEDIQVEKGSEATSYEPYTGGTPSPNPDYPQEIKSVVNPKLSICGKNLLPTTVFSDSITSNGVSFTNNGDGSITANGTAETTTYFKLWGWNELGDKGILPNLKIGDTIYSGDCIVQQTNSKKVISITEGITTVSSETTTMYIAIRVSKGETVNKTYYPYIVLGSTATDYESYKEQTATLPYTLNAIPVSRGGNVTINGQQYIADYVDVERGKVIRNILKWHIADLKRAFNNTVWHINITELGIDGSKIGLSNMFKIQSSNYAGVTTSELFIDYNGNQASLNMRGMTDEEFKKWISDKNPEVYNVLKVAEEIPITSEEVQTLKALTTYYPTTNISVNSEQVEGYTVFNYPISMANGWNYVKQQLNDSRDYIYDMDLQSAEAYVNSEYAVTLTELGV